MFKFLKFCPEMDKIPPIWAKNTPVSAETFLQCFGRTFGSVRFGFCLFRFGSAETQKACFGRALILAKADKKMFEIV